MTCDLCGRACKSAAGLSIHRRKAHRAAFDAPAPSNRLDVRVECAATMEQIAALGPERAHVFLAGVAQILSAARRGHA